MIRNRMTVRPSPRANARLTWSLLAMLVRPFCFHLREPQSRKYRRLLHCKRQL